MPAYFVIELDVTDGPSLADYERQVTSMSQPLLLLRPDRFVAAAIAISDVERCAKAVEALLDGTWLYRELNKDQSSLAGDK